MSLIEENSAIETVFAPSHSYVRRFHMMIHSSSWRLTCAVVTEEYWAQYQSILVYCPASVRMPVVRQVITANEAPTTVLT